MNSRVHPTFKTKYRVTNRADYDQALVQRGDITLWITPGAIRTWTPKSSGRRGAPRRYSDLAIETALTLRVIFRLPLRQAEGFLRSLLGTMDLSLEAPDHTTLSRRSKKLMVSLKPVNSKRGIHLRIDSAGLSLVGEGEWAAAKHGKRGKRGWRKLHLGVDRKGQIHAQVLTNSPGDDAKTGLGIIRRLRANCRVLPATEPTTRLPSTTKPFPEGAGRGAPDAIGFGLNTRPKVRRARPNDSARGQGWSQEVEEGVGLSPAGNSRERHLSLQVDAR